MKTFKSFMEEVKKPTGKLKNACWTGYTAVGTKEKNGRTVPNCVPVKEDGMGGGAIGSGGPTNVTGTATSTDPVSATAVDLRKKKKSGYNPVMMGMGHRKPPKI